MIKTILSKILLILGFLPVVVFAFVGVLVALLTKSFKLGYDLFNLETLKENISKK